MRRRTRMVLSQPLSLPVTSSQRSLQETLFHHSKLKTMLRFSKEQWHPNQALADSSHSRGSTRAVHQQLSNRVQPLRPSSLITSNPNSSSNSLNSRIIITMVSSKTTTRSIKVSSSTSISLRCRRVVLSSQVVAVVRF